jgi:acyl-coenzyme A thioesterase PaaI-like protein
MSDSFQDAYPDDLSVCYGCGRLNEKGLRVRSFWDGEETVCRFTPDPAHTAIAGYVYGGVIASVIDCHGTGTAAAAAKRARAGDPTLEPNPRFVTASLHVDYLKPTPIDADMELRGKIAELKGRKVVVDIEVFSKGVVCVRGRVVAVELPKDWRPDRV